MELELPRLLANSYRSLIEHFLSNIKRTPRSSPLRYTATPSDTVSSGFRLSLKLAPRRLKSLNVPLSLRDCGFAADCEAGFSVDRGDDLPAKCVFTIRKPLRLLLRPELFPTLTSRRPAVALGFTTLSRNLRLYDLFSTQVFCQHNAKRGANIWLVQSTRLALQLILDKGFRLFSFQLPDLKKPGIVIYCHYLPVSGLGNLRACCLPWMW